MIDHKYYTAGGRPVTATHLLLLLSEMEGVYQHLKYMGFVEDMDTIDKMKKRYYTLYFKKNKEENSPPWLIAIGRAEAFCSFRSQVQVLSESHSSV